MALATMKPSEKLELGESHFFVEVGGGEVGTEGDIHGRDGGGEEVEDGEG